MMTDEEKFQRGKQIQDVELSKTLEPKSLGNLIKGQQLIAIAAKTGHVLAQERLLYNSQNGQYILKAYEQRFTETTIENPLQCARISEIRLNELESKARKLADVSKLQLASALGNSDALQKIVSFYSTTRNFSINVLDTMELDLDVLCGGPDRGKEKNGSYKNSILQILAERGHKVVGIHKIQLIATETFDLDWMNFSNPIFEKHEFEYGMDNPEEAIKWLTFAGKCGFGWAFEKLISYHYEQQDWTAYTDWQTVKGLTLPDIQTLIGDYYKGCSTPAEMITAVKWYTAANRPESDIGKRLASNYTLVVPFIILFLIPDEVHKLIGDYYRNFPKPDDMLEAVRWYTMAKRPQHVEFTHVKLGNYYFGTQQWSEAIKYFSMANVPEEKSLRKIGNWYNAQSDPEAWVEALNWLKRANRPQGEIDVVNVKLGDYYYERQQWQVAIQYYNDASIPQEDTFKKIGDYHNGLHNDPMAWKEAIKWYKASKKSQPEIDSVNKKLGAWYYVAHGSQGWDDSMKHYGEAADLDTMKRTGDYYRDKDDPKEILLALQWYRKANRVQDLDLVNRKVGNYYFEREQWNESIQYYRDGGIPVEESHKKIGDYYYDKEDPEEIVYAVDWYKAANRPEDEIDAVHDRIGSIHLESPHVENWIESVKSFQFAKRPQAFINEVYKKIADHYKGCSAPSDWIQAIAYYELINEVVTVAELQNRLGNHYFDKGSSMMSNKDNKRNDLNEAVKWYRLAADSGHVESQYKLGLCYNNPLIYDPPRLEFWMCLAANHKSKEAIDFLYKYHPKTNVALDWVRSRAEAGDGKAQYRMARNYESGHVVKQDKVLAAEYDKQASGKGVIKKSYLSTMCSKLFPCSSKNRRSTKNASSSKNQPNNRRNFFCCFTNSSKNPQSSKNPPSSTSSPRNGRNFLCCCSKKETGNGRKVIPRHSAFQSVLPTSTPSVPGNTGGKLNALPMNPMEQVHLVSPDPGRRTTGKVKSLDENYVMGDAYSNVAGGRTIAETQFLGFSDDESNGRLDKGWEDGDSDD